METRYIYGLNVQDVLAYGEDYYSQAFATVTDCLVWRNMQDNPDQYKVYATDGQALIQLTDGVLESISAQEAFDLTPTEKEWIACGACEDGDLVLDRRGDWEYSVKCPFCNGTGEVAA